MTKEIKTTIKECIQLSMSYNVGLLQPELEKKGDLLEIDEIEYEIQELERKFKALKTVEEL